MEYIEREGTQEKRPAELDTTSSRDTVYFRRNIRQEETEEGMKWVYEEAEMSREEWEKQEKELRSPLACQIMQANNELIAKNELLQIEVESLIDYMFLEKAGDMNV